MKKIGQIIYPEGDKLPASNENIFQNKVVYSIGIYGKPGIKFKINNSSDIILNGTGIFQLDTTNNPITSLVITNLNLQENHFLSIDYIYEDQIGGTQ